MSDSNHIDDLMRSILENGQEDVPERVWEGVLSSLDKAARRKAVVVWFGRVGAVAAAAAIAVSVIFNTGKEDDLVPLAESDMIAVVHEEVQVETADVADITTDVRKDMVAYAAVRPVTHMQSSDTAAPVSAPVESQTVEYAPQTTETIVESPSSTPKAEPQLKEEVSEWKDDDREIRQDRKIKTAIVISGSAGTNDPQGKGGVVPVKSPALNRQYTQTTVEQTGLETSYGIPVSFGVGAKLRFNERWSLGMGVNYTLLTSRFNGKYIKVNEDGTEDIPVPGKVTNTLHYIGIPLNAYYDIIRHKFINFYAYAGGAVEKCVGNRYQIMASPVINHSEQVKGVQISANAGIGVEFMLGKYVGLYLDPSLRYYFRSTQPKSIRTAQPLMLGFEMGLRFNL